MGDALLALVAAAGALLAVAVVLLIAVYRRQGAPDAAAAAGFERLERAQERGERALREELAKSREEAALGGQRLREELAGSIKGHSDSLLRQLAELRESSVARINEVRGVVDARLLALQTQNDQKLDQMRATVEEKLQGTLEKRLGEAFAQVSERLEAVHKGLGEMQTLANGVGDLKKVLTNVKARGTWGEVQLGELLASVLAPEQFERNVATRPGGGERVEFAIRLPGRGDPGDGPLWLPIDAKFPQEDYHRLIEAEEHADREAADAARQALERRIREEAKRIRDKYVEPPHTTDFALLFLPTEGLYAEVLRNPGLVEKLQTECRVVVAGPTTLAALLNSLQMGFRSLAIQKRSSEVWKLLGAVKGQFGKFGDLLDGVQKKLEQASTQLDSAAKASRTIERSLRGVEALPAGVTGSLLPEPEAGSEADAADEA
jgi:DNA recombination protein RmuC